MYRKDDKMRKKVKKYVNRLLKCVEKMTKFVNQKWFLAVTTEKGAKKKFSLEIKTSWLLHHQLYNEHVQI